MERYKLTNMSNRVRGSLAGVMIGDALGLPVETASRADILKANDGGSVTGFDNVPRLTTFPSTKDLPLGTISDDGRLTLAVATSLVRCKRFNLLDSMREQLLEYERGIPGMGRATQTRFDSAKLWFESRGQQGEDPRTYPQNTSMGNGVAMKVAPLGIHAILSNKDNSLWRRVRQLGRATHGDLRASLAAFSVASLLSTVLRQSHPADRAVAFTNIRETHAKLHEIETLCGTAEDAQTPYGSLRDPNERRSFTSRLSLLLELAEDHGRYFGPGSSPEALLERVGGAGCIVMESVPLALGIFMRHPQDFEKAVLEAVNLGGDTDTIASMVGALVGASVGYLEIPQDLLTSVPAVAEATALANAMVETTWK